MSKYTFDRDYKYLYEKEQIQRQYFEELVKIERRWSRVLQILFFSELGVLILVGLVVMFWL